MLRPNDVDPENQFEMLGQKPQRQRSRQRRAVAGSYGSRARRGGRSRAAPRRAGGREAEPRSRRAHTLCRLPLRLLRVQRRPEPREHRQHCTPLLLLLPAWPLFLSQFVHRVGSRLLALQKGDLGTVSLGILYTSFTLFAVVASPVVTRLGPKRALVVGCSGYVFFILANLVPTWYVSA